jgi:hypothetical protein
MKWLILGLIGFAIIEGIKKGTPSNPTNNPAPIATNTYVPPGMSIKNYTPTQYAQTVNPNGGMSTWIVQPDGQLTPNV